LGPSFLVSFDPSSTAVLHALCNVVFLVLALRVESWDLCWLHKLLNGPRKQGLSMGCFCTCCQLSLDWKVLVHYLGGSGVHV
jgi:hypothetical protein